MDVQQDRPDDLYLITRIHDPDSTTNCILKIYHSTNSGNVITWKIPYFSRFKLPPHEFITSKSRETLNHGEQPDFSFPNSTLPIHNFVIQRLCAIRRNLMLFGHDPTRL